MIHDNKTDKTRQKEGIASALGHWLRIHSTLWFTSAMPRWKISWPARKWIACRISGSGQERSRWSGLWRGQLRPSPGDHTGGWITGCSVSCSDTRYEIISVVVAVAVVTTAITHSNDIFVNLQWPSVACLNVRTHNFHHHFILWPYDPMTLHTTECGCFWLLNYFVCFV